MFTTQDASTAASYLLAALYPAKCEAVGLFGSIARSGQGNDIDLVVFTPLPFTAHQVFAIATKLTERLKTEKGRKLTKDEKAEIRREAARQLLGLKRLTPLEIDETAIDILVYPFYYDFNGAVDELRRKGEGKYIESRIVRDLLILDHRNKNFFRIG